MKGKQILTIWLAIYPLITVLSYFIGPYLRTLPLPVGTFITTIIVVPIMIHWGIPFSHHLVFKFSNVFNKNAHKEIVK